MHAQNIDTDKININLLPRMIRELVGIVGINAALNIARVYSGVRLYVPNKADPAHALVPVIGYDKLQELCRSAYRGEDLEIPKIDKALMQLKHHLVREMRAANCSERQIARELNYTERRVRQLKADEPERNMDLFEE